MLGSMRVNQKIQVIFKYNDAIFRLSHVLDEADWEALEDYSECNCCGAKDKLKNCHFCGMLTCAKDLEH